MIETDVLHHVVLLTDVDSRRKRQFLQPADLLFFGLERDEASQQDVLAPPRDPVRVALDRVSDRTLVYIMGLMLYGKGAQDPACQRSFQDALNEAQRYFDAFGRAHTAARIQEEPLSRYLPAGLARLNGAPIKPAGPTRGS